MDEIRFDLVARLLGRSANRRAIATLVGAVAAGSTLGGGDAKRRRRRNHCFHDGRRCGKKSGSKGGACKRCCSKFSFFASEALTPSGTRRCSCRHDGMSCTRDAQCCEGACNLATGICDNGLPADPPITCSSSTPFCQEGAQNCGSTTKCCCVTTNSDEQFCTTGNFNCEPIYANVTCNDDTDCINDYGGGWVCVSASDCPSSTPCSGPGGTVCMEICGL